MGRKIFGQPVAADPAPPAPQNLRSELGGSVGGLRDSLREITANAIRDIDPSRIDQDGLRDRLSPEDDGIDALAESIRKHGQQVPILVRPSGSPDRYRIIYGRRRLAAVQRVGGTIKAIVRTLDDEASLVAQGQENNLRLDPSFIEKALFIRDMQSAGYRPQVIQDALGLTRQGISNHKVVLDQLPSEVIALIGPAHGVGRRQWSDLAATLDAENLIDVAQEVLNTGTAEIAAAGRFQAVMDAALRRRKSATPQSAPSSARDTISGPDGAPIAAVQRTRQTLALQVPLGPRDGFGRWLDANVETICHELHARWQKERERG